MSDLHVGLSTFPPLEGWVQQHQACDRATVVAVMFFAKRMLLVDRPHRHWNDTVKISMIPAYAYSYLSFDWNDTEKRGMAATHARALEGGQAVHHVLQPCWSGVLASGGPNRPMGSLARREQN